MNPSVKSRKLSDRHVPIPNGAFVGNGGHRFFSLSRFVSMASDLIEFTCLVNAVIGKYVRCPVRLHRH